MGARPSTGPTHKTTPDNTTKGLCPRMHPYTTPENMSSPPGNYTNGMAMKAAAPTV